MTEDDWLTSTDPHALLAYVQGTGRASERKHRLFAVACCRVVWDLLGGRQHRKMISVGERYAEGQASAQALERAERNAFHSPRKRRNASCEVPESAASFARVAAHGLLSTGYRFGHTIRSVELALAEVAEPAPLHELLRCVFGNPFRAMPPLDPAWLAWHDGLVRRLAESSYGDRELPSGHLDPDLLAVLADALEEAGCTRDDLLAHLRGPGPHVRGCWALDLLLEKS